ncbi:MAG TPA: FAD-dependent thymidylate synthase [Myxococcaceae bacterium]|nr:FAD-dependent thymidylate synthase [Myxococcaceae bacterium]
MSERAPFLSPPPKVTLTNGFVEPYDNAVATARTCYSSRVITAQDVRKDEKARALRDRIAQETYIAGHHTTLQHATFQFALENVSRQAIWSFLHSHPFYNSEQVSQRYVEVKPGNVILPDLPEPLLAVYRGAVEEQLGCYQALIGLLTPKVSEEFFRIFPARRRTPEKWSLGIKKKAQEIARYVLPIGTFAHLYHTVSGITLHRYHRLCQQWDVPTETRLMVKAMVEAVRTIDPLFFDKIEDPLPLEATLEHRTLREHGRLRVSGGSARAFNREFDAELSGRMAKLVDYKVNAEASVAQGVRAVLGLTRAELSDEAALEQVLSPEQNPYLGEALVLTTVSKLTRALSHAHYTFQKKLSHTADSQDQRHRMAPASRPVLHAQFSPGEVDVVVPDLIEAVPEAKARFLASCERTWGVIARLLDAGVAEESALYLLPNAFPIRFVESGELTHLHHKWVHRLCYTAQEEIWRASLEEVAQVRAVHPLLARHIHAPCTLRKEAGITPFCPEGPRFCGVPVWKLDLPQMRRLI